MQLEKNQKKRNHNHQTNNDKSDLLKVSIIHMVPDYYEFLKKVTPKEQQIPEFTL